MYMYIYIYIYNYVCVVECDHTNNYLGHVGMAALDPKVATYKEPPRPPRHYHY